MAKRTTFCTCIEPGPLEQQVILLAETLRAFGGVYADMPFLAIQPRKGLALSSATRKELARLGVDYVRRDLVGEYSWYNNINKSAAMSWAETAIGTDYLTWLDGDMVIVREPEGLLTESDFGFAARAGEGYLGSDGTDVNAPYWRKVSSILGVPYDDTPLIESLPERRMIHEYYQSGVYTVHKDEEVSRRHFDFMKRILDARIASQSCGTYHYDQVTVSMAARGTRRQRELYDFKLNYNFNMIKEDSIAPDMVASCYILHYHGSFYEDSYQKAKPHLAPAPQALKEMIDARAPFIVHLGPAPRLARKAFSLLRERKRAAFAAECVTF